MRTICVRECVAELMNNLKTETRNTDAFSSKEKMCSFLQDVVKEYYKRLHNNQITTETLTHVVYVFCGRENRGTDNFIVKLRFDEDKNLESYVWETFPSLEGMTSVFGKSSVFLMHEYNRSGYPFMFDFSL